MLNENTQTYEKGELVPVKGTYRCTECGEMWTTDEVGVRFPPCDADKSGQGRWTLVEAEPE